MNVHTNLEYVQYKSQIPDKFQMSIIEMSSVHNTNLDHIHYKSQNYINVMWWPELHMYITINIYDYVGSPWLSIFERVCDSPGMCERKIKIHYEISYI